MTVGYVKRAGKYHRTPEIRTRKENEKQKSKGVSKETS